MQNRSQAAGYARHVAIGSPAQAVVGVLLGGWATCIAGEPSGANSPPSPAIAGKQSLPPPSTAGAVFSRAAGQFNRGAALLEQYKYSKAVKPFEAVLELAPDWDAARFNLGLACLNMQGKEQKAHGFEAAHKAFTVRAEVQSRPSSCPLLPGPLLPAVGRERQGAGVFRGVYRHDQEDPCVAYKCGEIAGGPGAQRGRHEDVRTGRSRSIRASFRPRTAWPCNTSAPDQPEKAEPLFERFQELSAAELTGGTVSVQKVYGMAGKYYLALGADNLPLPPQAAGPSRRVVFSPEIRRLRRPRSAWKWSGRDGRTAGHRGRRPQRRTDISTCASAA